MRNLAIGVSIAALILLGFRTQGAAPLPWLEGQGVRTVELRGQANGKPGFTSIQPQETGVWFTNELRGDMALTNSVAHNGSGVAIGDMDGDGWPDLYFCNLQGLNRLYRNLGNWHFEEVPLGEAACTNQLSTGAGFADVDGDGDLDLLVNGIAAGTRLFINDGKGRFSEARDSGLSRTASATSMALADIDGDGDLDLYCTHYIDVMHLADPTMRFGMFRDGGQWRITKVNDEPVTRPYWKDRFEVLPDGRVRELPEVDGFYRNDGTGHFTAIQSEPGVFLNAEGSPIPPYRDWGLSVMFRDLNGDSAPDIYVCNDNASPSRLWLNTGKGTFRAPQKYVFRHTSRSSMALDFADVNRDGCDDLFVLDMLARSPARRMMQLVRDYPDPAGNDRVDEVPRFNRNVLFLGRPDGTFAETAFMAGIAATDWSWSAIFIDIDLDGYEDLLVSNGFEFDVMDQDSQDRLRTAKLTFEQRKRIRQFQPPWPTQSIAFRNRRDGTFEQVSEEWGFCRGGISYGMALGDLDNDGDLDVVINNLNDVASMYRNDATGGRVAVRLKGMAPNTSGVGARLRLTGGAVTQSQEVMCGGRYLSCDQALRVFAAPAGEDKPLQLEVTWRNGDRMTVPVKPNTIVEVSPPGTSTQRTPKERPPEAKGWFADASSLLGHVHVEDGLDDWASQPLLPRRLSRLGPGLSWYDLDGDGWEDLTISASQGGQLAVFLNDQGRGFRSLKADTPAPHDQGAVVGWPDGNGHRSLLVAESNLELTSTQDAAIEVYTVSQGTSQPAVRSVRRLAAGAASPGPLALADIDGDGDLDVFVGGRFRPGRYPEPVPSLVWLNEKGELRPNAAVSEPFAALGLVSGATFCDLDGDGAPDLALAIEWGPLRVFRNNRGRFQEMTAAWGFSGKTGWWTSVTAGDFDGDGRVDLAAGNWGRNSPYELYRPSPLRLFYDDGGQGGTMNIVEAWQSGDQWLPVRNRLWLARGFPDLPQRFLTHEAFGKATVQQILSDRFNQARTVEATFLESAVFLNRGTNFVCVPLPREAQLTPAFAVNSGDFDGDGIEDLFLSQNFFGSGSDLSREDAGRGLLLRGNGDGTFTAVESGLKIYGEQRGAALADFNHDGRIDLAVTQNNGPTKLYLNEHARRGLRVVLTGDPGNPDAIGAQLRVKYRDGHGGPSRTIQAGSGYWSQDSAVQVLGLSGTPEAVSIRWPQGREQVVPLKEDQWELYVETVHENK